MSKHLIRWSGAVGAVLVAIAVMAPLAQAETPDPSYAKFAGCASPKTENPAVVTCLRGVITSGHSRFGKQEVPISIPITFSGGAGPLFEGGPLYTSPSGGVEPVKEPVPGGLKLGLLGTILNVKQQPLYAATEVIGTPSVGLNDMHMQIRVHLINPMLGSNCYIGSAANPITLNLTTGTTSPPPPNKPITGEPGFLEFEPVLEIQNMLNQVMVDNAFAVPSATGCALSLFRGALSINLDKQVNSQVGLPAPAGTSEVVQSMNIELVNAGFVYP